VTAFQSENEAKSSQISENEPEIHYRFSGKLSNFLRPLSETTPNTIGEVGEEGIRLGPIEKRREDEGKTKIKFKDL
jgi:hypothetical protein